MLKVWEYFGGVYRSSSGKRDLGRCTDFQNKIFYDVLVNVSSLIKKGTNFYLGCMGDLIRREVDLCLSVSPDLKRFEYVEFTSTMAVTAVSFLIKKPALKYSWKTVFFTFSPIVWTVVAFSIISTTVAVYQMEDLMDPQVTVNTSKTLKIFKIGLGLIGYLVGQSTRAPKYGLIAKYTFLLWLYCGFVIGVAYVSSLQSLIVSPGMAFVPATFKELVQSEYKWGASNGFRSGLGEQIFKNSDNPVMKAIYQGMDVSKDLFSCISRVATSKYACFGWDLLETFYLQTRFADRSGNHPFQFASERAFNTRITFATRKREIFISHFNDFIERAQDSGLASQMIEQDWRKYRMAGITNGKNESTVGLSEGHVGGPRAFGLDSVKGSFVIFGCGISFTLVEFSAEFLFGIYQEVR